MKELKNLSESEKINYLITKIDQIEKQLNPPLWRKFLSWFFAHFWTLLILAIMGYFMWQVWEIVQHVQDTINGFENRFTDFRVAIEAQIQKLQDQASQFGIDKIKFWE